MSIVSVIVPVYNCEQYLSECVDSILSQRFRDLELILVDDGSSDGSGALVDGYAEADPRVKAVHLPENAGPSAARNAGLELASGEFICMADSDDVMYPDLLETVIPRFADGYEMIVFGHETISSPEKANRLAAARKEKLISLDTDAKKFDFLAGPFRRGEIRWEIWNRVYRRDIIEKWHVRFPRDRRAFPEDMFFNFCYIAHIGKILILPDILYGYRIRGGSFMDSARRSLKIAPLHLMVTELHEHYSSSSDCKYLRENFPALYHLLHRFVFRHLRKYQWHRGLSTEDARELLKENIEDYPAFKSISAGAYRSPLVAENSKNEGRPIVRLCDRLYTEELLEINTPGCPATLRRLLLGLLRVLYVCKSRLRASSAPLKRRRR